MYFLFLLFPLPFLNVMETKADWQGNSIPSSEIFSGSVPSFLPLIWPQQSLEAAFCLGSGLFVKAGLMAPQGPTRDAKPYPSGLCLIGVQGATPCLG